MFLVSSRATPQHIHPHITLLTLRSKPMHASPSSIYVLLFLQEKEGSIKRVTSSRSGSEMSAGHVFHRGDGDVGAWDDSELIAAWNKQLQRLQDGNDAASDAASSGASESSSAEEGQTQDDAGLSEANDNLASSSETGIRKRQRADSAEREADRHLPPIPHGVPEEMHRLLRAWFQAGFETGYYCARRESTSK